MPAPPPPPAAADHGGLEARLGHRFTRPEYLERALTHKSWCNERGDREDNERLEFLGDAVLGLAVSDLLMRAFPARPEGELSKLRAALVGEPGLARVAETLQLGQWIYLGRGQERDGGRQRASILANVLEAVIGAVYLDAGFSGALALVERLFGPRLADAEFAVGNDFKSRLQELVQARYRREPEYLLVGGSGPDHAREFEVAVRVEGREVARATGRSKKAAQQAAAARALDHLELAPGAAPGAGGGGRESA